MMHHTAAALLSFMRKPSSSTSFIFFILVFSAQRVTAEKCTTCKTIVKNVMEGIERTAKSNFGGGNTRWEEKSLGSYTFSETRLVEILDGACKDGAKECHPMLEEHEETLEDWWNKLYAKGKEKDLVKYLCINQLEVCCPNGTYGPNCKDCPNGPSLPCKGTGKCKGDGTRDGKGNCVCDSGYKGEVCDECSDKYYEESKNDTHTVCKACDKSCESTCWEAGPSGCDECSLGWELVEDVGCEDVNECEPGTPCEENEYCTNTQGSYKCSVCAKSCDGCTGPAANQCIQCGSLHYFSSSWCLACHKSCETSCTDGTARTCDQCKEGWTLEEVNGCVDIDECATGAAECAENEYCANSEGSYSCPICHYACKGCTGALANQCIECNGGYQLGDDGYCSDTDECDLEGHCPGEHARCTNTPGSYKCGCENGYVLKDGACQEKPKDSGSKNKRQSSSSSSSESSVDKKSSSKTSESKKKRSKESSGKKKSKKKKVPTATLR